MAYVVELNSISIKKKKKNRFRPGPITMLLGRGQDSHVRHVACITATERSSCRSRAGQGDGEKGADARHPLAWRDYCYRYRPAPDALGRTTTGRTGETSRRSVLTKRLCDDDDLSRWKTWPLPRSWYESVCSYWFGHVAFFHSVYTSVAPLRATSGPVVRPCREPFAIKSFTNK